MKMKREDFQNSECLFKGSAFGKPDLNRVEIGGHTLMVKDVQPRSFFFRWTLGLWLIHKEWKIYSRLAGIHGIPKAMERIDRFAFSMEFVPGRPLKRGESLPLSFFSDLERILRDIHSRGVFHLDLRHKGNILVSEKGEPFLIDFNSSFSFKEKGLRPFCLSYPEVGGLWRTVEIKTEGISVLNEARRTRPPQTL